ncbi:MAG: prenyltransferase [Acidimicrobiales bacterium]
MSGHGGLAALRHIPPRSLSSAELTATAESIAAVQLPSGMIPWYPGGHADPWNHVEAAMALAVAGLVGEAEGAYAWLAGRQHPDGSWCSYYQACGVEEPRRDTNMCAYVATGVWLHYLVTGDRGSLESLWPTVDRAMGFVVAQQRPGGEVAWSVDPDGRPARDALLAASSSIRLSLRCALAIAGRLGAERPAWHAAAVALAGAIAARPGAFRPKARWSMDWYYPVLAGGLAGPAAAAHMAKRWDELVIDGVGVRCVSDRDWVTTAETAECAIALAKVGRRAEATELLDWTRAMRHPDGSYWTGVVHPRGGHFPGGERSTYSAAAVVLATSILDGLVGPKEEPEAATCPGLFEAT